jgi:hypothetical protein
MKSKIYLKDENLRRAFEYFDKVILLSNILTYIIGQKWNNYFRWVEIYFIGRWDEDTWEWDQEVD